MVDEADSKTSSPSVAGVGKSLRQSSVFQIRFFICLSHPSCVSLQIPGNACPGVKKYICRCVGIGRRGGLKIRWANNSCGFDPRHRHQTNIIRTRSSLWETGSDYLFALASSRKPISETVLSNGQNQNPEGQEKRESNPKPTPRQPNCPHRVNRTARTAHPKRAVR